MKTRRKLLAMLMSLAMMLTMVPTMALAEGEVAEVNGTQYTSLVDAVAAANESGNCTIEILADIDFSTEELAGYKWAGSTFNPLRISASGVTINLNQHRFYNMGNSAIELGSIYAKDGTIASATIMNGTLEAGTTDGVTNSYVLLLGGVANAVVSGVTTNGGINVCAGTNATIQNCNVTGTKYYTVCAQTGSHVIINGTSFTKPNAGAANTMFWIQGSSTDEDCITDSNPNGAFEASSITIEGGSFTKNDTAKFYSEVKPVVKGGNYGFDPSGCVVEGYSVTESAGSYTVSKDVAQIDETTYATLEAAFAAAVDGGTITVLADCSGNGIKVPEGKFKNNGLTVVFGNHTYTMDGTLVGSTGTETQAFQLLKDNKITFQNGTITSTKAKILVQNYSNLTLDGMTLTLNNPDYAYAYTLSNNNGNIVIDDTTINANPAGGFAFDVCRYASYPSVNVTVTGNSVINGKVEVSASGSDEKDGFRLEIQSGTINGAIVVDSSAETAMANTPEKATISITGGTFSTDPSEYVALGYEATQSGSEWTVGKKHVETLAVTQKENSSATTGTTENLSVSVAVATETTPKTATITPVTVSGGVTDANKGKVTEIKQDTLTEYVVANDIKKVEIVTGLSATTAPGGAKAPQTIIKDDAGNTVFEAVAKGGGLRFDNKVDTYGHTYGKSDTVEKTKAYDYVDLRLQYEFKLPDGVNVAADSTSWYWTFKYVNNNNVEQSATVNGTNYLPVANKTNTYTSNVLVLNVPLAHIADNFKAMLTITYELDGVTYTVSQSDATPLARVITDLARSYSETELTQMGTAATNYITALKNVITAYMNEKSENSGWTDTH